MIGSATPADRKAALRQAMLDTFRDADFLKECAELTLTVAPIDVDVFERTMTQTYQMPPRVIERMRNIYANQ
jgi:hypothetical protein